MKTKAQLKELFSSHGVSLSLFDYLEKYGDPNKIEEQVKEVLNGVPIQYVVGNVDFYHANLEVNDSVLIPRFETEELCDKVIHILKTWHQDEFKIADIGTGSGCIAITMKQAFPKASVTGVDISLDALKVAKSNGIRNHVDILWQCGDLLQPLEGKYDCIISNPPYIDEKDPEVMPQVRTYEPHLALFAEEDGYANYHKILTGVKPYLKERYLLAFEIGYQQKEHLEKFAKKLFPDAMVSVEKDASGKDRFLFILKK